MKKNRKGIILAGGTGSRLYPSTKSISKQLLPVYDKPLIYYPLALLLNYKIKEILIIVTEENLRLFKNLLGDGSNFGVSISFKIQKEPKGIAEALILAEDFLDGAKSILLLGDNIFYGANLNQLLQKADKNKGATVFSYKVTDPQRFGIVEFDKKNNVKSIQEKPKKPKSPYAVVGLYFYDNNASEYVKSLKPSNRGELEITDLNKMYLEKGLLNNLSLGEGYAWFDTGTPDSMLSASNFIQTIEKNQGIKIACLEEIAHNRGLISNTSLKKALKNNKDDYSKYIFEKL